MKRFRSMIAILLALILVYAPLLQTETSAVVSDSASAQVLTEASSEAAGEYLPLEEAGALLRQYMVERRSDDLVIKVHLDSDRYLAPEDVQEILTAEAIKHTGNGKEGDTLRWGWNQLGTTMFRDDRDGTAHDITISLTGGIYYSTAQQEAELDSKVEQILTELDLDEKSDYDKVFAIYDYVCRNVKYSDAYLSGEYVAGSPDWLEVHSVYGALVEGEAVCQGFAGAMYRLLLEAGIDNRIISGDNHGWNIVKLGDLYYCLDATWDSDTYHSGGGNYRWFLKGASDFLDVGHTTDPYCATEEFRSEYPISPLNYGAEATATASGTFGSNHTWILTEDGTLTISGSGVVEDIGAYNQPWKTYRGYIQKVVIESGVTFIGGEAFYACQELTQVSIPDTVTYIGPGAFALCGKLENIVIPDSVTNIGASAFFSCWSLSDVILPKNLEAVTSRMFMSCLQLKTVRIPDGVQAIGEMAFANCTALTGLTIPETVTQIGNGAFSSAFDPAADASIVIPESVTKVGETCFAWSGIHEIIWNANTEKLDTWVFYLCYYLEEVTLSDFILEFGDSVFQKCVSLKTVNLPAKLKTVGEWTFLDCVSLSAIELPDTLEALSVHMFSGCESLTQINIPEQITVIPVGAFSGTGLTSIELHNGITEIGLGAFAGTALQEVTIPASVITLGYSAFGDCPALKKVMFIGSAPSSFGNDTPGGVFRTMVERDLTVYYPSGDSTWTEDILNGLVFGTAWLKVCAYDPETGILFGDANGDGSINTTDAKLIMQFELGIIDSSALYTAVADVNGDGTINTTDAKLIMQLELGIITEFSKSN